MRVRMIPMPDEMGGEESGIKRVVEAYAKYGPAHDIQFVKSEEDYDVLAVHAGMTDSFPHNKPMVSVTHGLYWTGDYQAPSWEWKTNAKVINAVRHSRVITVPSAWVGETFSRDMHIRPIVVPHGIEWEDWQHKEEIENYILWNKNRAFDVCSPRPVAVLAASFPDTQFYATVVGNEYITPNVKVIGLQPHYAMRKIVQKAVVYLSTTKETFGIGVLEALASGTPVLGFAHGGNVDLIQHGVNGYLARVEDYDDLRNGLLYCIDNREILSANAIETAKKWTWDNALEELKYAFDTAYYGTNDKPSVGVVIPSYNYADKVERAVRSAMNQTVPVDRITVVDDGSSDDGATRQVVDALSKIDKRVRYLHQPNSGVANARNNGIDHTHTKYIICLDADDAIDTQFVEACLPELEKDYSLGIAYTGILAIEPNGAQSVSPWPGAFDYDLQIQRHNQVPTCCIFRREMWERLGGYRQRYAPNGAGAEDAEFWTRAGALGFGAKKVTDAPLFIYSWLSGRVSGNRDYHEVDWLAWHPWTEDGLHPFASVATPKRLSHPVRQYDQPIVSVIIPVGPKHVKEIGNALDSLEAQTFRQWEVIVADDTGDEVGELWKHNLITAYPFVRFVKAGKREAGAARNEGARMARAPFLVFLDADDWLHPSALKRMLEIWESSQSIVYTDYVGKSYINENMALSLGDRLMEYDPKDGYALISYHASEYDCVRASYQPDPMDMYIWSLITALVPRVWHNEIGGFDEDMHTWEDWDYWLRMARHGKCFERVAEPLVAYRFYTGTRRELGVQEHQNLIEYLRSKYNKDAPMPCNCGGNRAQTNAALDAFAQRQSQAQSILSGTGKGNGNKMSATKDEEFVLCLYDHANRGQHMVIGAATGTPYGYRGGGDKFLVHKSDIASQPNIFKPIVIETSTPLDEPATPPPPKAVAKGGDHPPKEVVDALGVATEEGVKEFSLTLIPGVTEQISQALQARGVHSLQDLVNLGSKNLLQVKGIGPARADAIISYAKKTIEEEEQNIAKEG